LPFLKIAALKSTKVYRWCIFYYVEFYACSDRAKKANLFISAFFLQATKCILMPLYVTPHITQLVVFLTTVTVSSTSLWDSTKKILYYTKKIT